MTKKVTLGYLMDNCEIMGRDQFGIHEAYSLDDEDILEMVRELLEDEDVTEQDLACVVMGIRTEIEIAAMSDRAAELAEDTIWNEPVCWLW